VTDEKQIRSAFMKIEKGMKVFITGAASGIGRATAVAVAGRGARMFLTDINGAGLAETVKMIEEQGGEVVMHRPFDISSLEEVKAFADEAHAGHGPMDIIMNIAGIALYALIEDMEHEHWAKVIRVNLWGPIHVIECFLPKMIEAKRGHVVNVSSASGLAGAPWHAAYAAAKFGLVGISEVIYFDGMQHNIGCTVICPGAVETPLKDTVEILGGGPDSPEINRMKKGFSRHAIPPERVAGQIIRAVEKNRFLVITSLDIKLAYFFKKFIPPLYHYIMVRISKLLNNTKAAVLAREAAEREGKS
jgi:NAD(P)-dependent dehydrogenase (short-subunit alcohol dehydrogenase family)